MKRIDEILEHEVFKQELNNINEAEKTRCFCNHDMGHLMDVARIAWILNLEEGIGLEKELVYATALLHDIGKGRQYKEGIAHEIAGSEIAPEILKDCGFSEEEIFRIKRAILSHRDPSVKEHKNLRGVIYRADKASRACFMCKTSKECNWPEEKKNSQVMY
ncbi:MAG: HD domain-containing protein [Lachnospiraceae bacterium]|nr:HD domain-containing protein [Lachnospiraceae bacterium]